MKEKIIIALIFLGLGATLTACGIRPSDLEAPESAETGFPHTYPAETTDPPPPLKPTAIDVVPTPEGSGPIVTY